MKLITRMLLGLIAVVATLFIAAAFLISTINLAQHKDRIQQFVFDQTGRSLEIRGRVDAQLFPWAGFSLHNVTLAGAEGFYTENFARVEHVAARLRLLPLIVGNVSIKDVHLQGLELDLQRNPQGRSNWDDLMSNTSVVTTDVSNDDVLQEIEAGTPIVAALSVGQLVVSDSVVRWRDELAGQKFLLSDFRFSTGAITLSESFRVETGFVINGFSSFPKTRLNASGMAGINLAENVYRVDSFQVDSVFTFDNNSLHVNHQDAVNPQDTIDRDLNENLTNNKLPPKTDNENSSVVQDAVTEIASRFSGSVVADLNAQRVDVAPVTVDVEGVVMNGELHMTELFDNPGVFGFVQSDSIDADAILTRWLNARAAALPVTFDQTLLQDFDLSANFQRAEENFLISDVRFGNQHAELTGNFQVANYQRAPVLTGTINSNTINPALWTDAMGFSPVDKTALAQAHLRLDIRQSGQILVLNDIEFTVDDSKVTGDIEFVKTNEGQIPIRFELHADSINFDRYFHGGVNIDALRAVANDPDLSLPVQTINAIDIQGKLSAARLQWSGLQFTDVSVPLRLAQGRVEGLEIKATTYQGTLFATVVLDVTPDEPLLTATISLNAVDLKPMMNAALETDNAVLSGTGIANIDLLSRGATVAEMTRRAGGALNIRVTDGAIDGVDLVNDWSDLLAEYLISSTAEGTVLPDAKLFNRKTGIDELSMSWELAEGRLYSDDLDWRSAGMRVTGQGGIALGQQLVDYLLQVALVKGADGAEAEGSDWVLGSAHQEMVGITLPLEIQGSLNDLAHRGVAALSRALKAELSRSDVFGGVAEASAAALDLERAKQRLVQRHDEAVASLKVRLQEQRSAAQRLQPAPGDAPVKAPADATVDTPGEPGGEEQEASNRVNEAIERETDELKNRLQNNLQKDAKRKLSNLSED